MDVLSVCVCLALVYILVRLLHWTAAGEQPKLYYKHPMSPFVQNLIELCPILTHIYTPTTLWGKSGHFQTCIHAKIGRTKPKKPMSQRFHLPMPDGATMSYDIFRPQQEGHKAEFTLAICPGIANTSECIYISHFASYAQSHGYRVAVLNHLGSLKSEKLTSPRIFTYCGTDEYKLMIDRLLDDFPDTKIIAVGFSMGGNIVTKYLGESRENQSKVLCGVSICQGYEVNSAKDYFLEWENLRRMYFYGMTIKQRRLLSRHRGQLFSDTVKQTYKQVDEDKVFKATSLVEIDKHYSCYVAGFDNIQEYYHWVSCAHTMQNITIPMVFMNAEDDPLVPEKLFVHPRQTAEKSDNCLFITTKHGGHLGYFEGGYMIPNELTWQDRFVIEYADAAVHLYLSGQLPGAESFAVSHTNSIQTNINSNCDISESTSNESFVSSGSGELIMTSKIRNDTLEKQTTGKEKAKGGSLKRGAILQATSFVQ